MKTNVCVLIADGTEEMEAVIVVDVLRRAGISVFLAGVGGDRLQPDGGRLRGGHEYGFVVQRPDFYV